MTFNKMLKSIAVSAAFLLSSWTFRGCTATPVPSDFDPRQTSNFAGYLVATFSDATPAVQFHLSNGNNPGSFSFSNGGKPILTSNVGTKGVRDIFLTSTPDRSKWFVIATDLDINAPGFNWDKATRTGSRSLVVWSSTNLLDWSQPRLAQVESATAGMTWAPSAVWSAEKSLFYVFWSSRHYSSSDPSHSSAPVTLDKIRYTTTKDFITFTPAADYLSLSNTPLIDQEFQALDSGGKNYIRYLKNETVNQVYCETSNTGIFGAWTRLPGYVRPESPTEGPASFADNTTPGLYHLWLDNYTEYVPFEVNNPQTGGKTWTKSSYAGNVFPKGLKHGNVTPLLKAEYDAWKARYH